MSRANDMCRLHTTMELIISSLLLCPTILTSKGT